MNKKNRKRDNSNDIILAASKAISTLATDEVNHDA